MTSTQNRQDFHRVDLETAAALGCSKCLHEYETGEKTRRNHDDNCPRKRHTEPSAAAAGSKRKRAREAADGAEGGGDGDAEGAEGDASRTFSARVGNNVDFPLTNLHSHLVCSLCKGYFRDPHTVADCLHTFCRSCLILFFRQGMRCCPTCNTRLGPDPFHTSISIQSREVMPDRTLQAVVDKIFPWMRAEEEEEERDFYLRRGIDLKPEYAQEAPRAHPARAGGGGRPGASAPVSAAVDPDANPAPPARGGRRAVPRPDRPPRSPPRENDDVHASLKMMEDLMDVNLEPDGQPPGSRQRLPPLRSSLLRTSGRLKIVSVKKYVAQRLGMRESRGLIEVLCNGDPMGDELSLTFILRTRWFSTNKVLTLKYRLEEEEAAK